MNIENASFKIKPGMAPGTQVYALLQEEIATIRIPPGTALSEKMLAERLGVSRTPVREALIRLSEDGLVYIVPKSGTFVSPIDVDAVLDAHLIRESLLCATVFLAARKRHAGRCGQPARRSGTAARPYRRRPSSTTFSKPMMSTIAVLSRSAVVAAF